jgi:hypothetical protein
MVVASSSSTLQRKRNRSGRMPWLSAWASSSSSHGAPNAMRFDPTRSRRQGEPVLQTYDKGNSWGRVGDCERFGRCLETVRTASNSALASRRSSTASPCSLQAPPWVNCFGCRWIKLVRWLSLCARVCGLQDKIWRVRAAIYRASRSYS